MPVTLAIRYLRSTSIRRRSPMMSTSAGRSLEAEVDIIGERRRIEVDLKYRMAKVTGIRGQSGSRVDDGARAHNQEDVGLNYSRLGCVPDRRRQRLAEPDNRRT